MKIMILAFAQGFSSTRYLRNVTITKCHLLHLLRLRLLLLARYLESPPVLHPIV